MLLLSGRFDVEVATAAVEASEQDDRQREAVVEAAETKASADDMAAKLAKLEDQLENVNASELAAKMDAVNLRVYVACMAEALKVMENSSANRIAELATKELALKACEESLAAKDAKLKAAKEKVRLVSLFTMLVVYR